MRDVLFRTDSFVFSYRVAGICVENGRVLLQKPLLEDGYAFPGGHAALGETNAETLKREFREEIGTEIAVEELKWVGEIFFPWGGQPCHQLCLYYRVRLLTESIPRSGSFPSAEMAEGKLRPLAFHWVELERLGNMAVYPPQAAELLARPDGHVEHFVYRE